MHDITEHDSEQEGEGDDGGDGRVEFLVIWSTISINNKLENINKIISLKRRWLCHIHIGSIDLLKSQSHEILLVSDLS
jgi:hypothetical protein